MPYITDEQLRDLAETPPEGVKDYLRANFPECFHTEYKRGTRVTNRHGTGQDDFIVLGKAPDVGALTQHMTTFDKHILVVVNSRTGTLTWSDNREGWFRPRNT